ncbi:MAG: FAD-dependent tricarballylate dehydrogenase TcuA [Betaproteobacteria bacterium]|nr:FAD-dependent tricarballylate dehydrogenase TcuA [Betaproteobacteria bacterium]
MLAKQDSLPTTNHEVLILGTGLAGMAAALAARQAGAAPFVIDKAPETSKSGNTRFSGGGLRCPSEEHTIDSLLEELERMSDGRTDMRLARILYRDAESGVNWLRELGIPIVSPSVERPDVRGGRMRYHIRGNGYGLVDALFPKLGKAGIAVQFQTKAIELLTSGTGQVVGARVNTPEGCVDMLARAVILATGGFQANTAMRVQYLGREAGDLLVRGSKYDTGEGLRMALRLGAQSYGDWGGFHSAVLDARSAQVEAGETNVNTYPYTIIVNKNGERFLDEGEDFMDTTYVKYGKAILQQPGRIAYCLFDAKIAERDLVYCLHREFEPIDAGSWERLAQKIRVPADRLRQTIDSFNAAVQPGEFDPERRDGKSTRGIYPPKSNWAVPLDTPPFFAYPVTGGITFTLGGLRVDDRARVLDTEDHAIPGLYAAGELLGGFFYNNYPGGASLMRSLVFGRLAGAEAAGFASRK